MEGQIPAAPAILPAAEQAKWKQRYAEGRKQGLIDSNGSEAEAAQYATKFANQMLRVPEITSVAQAKSLPAWMILKADEATGKVVTADGKKYEFEVVAAPAASEQKPIEKMTVAELVAYAKEHGITLPDGAKKDEILDAIKKAAEAPTT
ncbi:MAG TPA: Rho termination factor N-terminal domain-containing protein [Terriglobales bacterium]|nr:Rho termination factor N-terminal domain-containing protein [Clostridia bacterium]HWR17127.1 Rho termination factor N-terminal domain-containing protein [Terriglobales bacterium]